MTHFLCVIFVCSSAIYVFFFAQFKTNIGGYFTSYLNDLLVDKQILLGVISLFEFFEWNNRKKALIPKLINRDSFALDTFSTCLLINWSSSIFSTHKNIMKILNAT